MLFGGSLWSLVISVGIEFFFRSVWLGSLHSSDACVVESFNGFFLGLLPRNLPAAVKGFLRLMIERVIRVSLWMNLESFVFNNILQIVVMVDFNLSSLVQSLEHLFLLLSKLLD